MGKEQQHFYDNQQLEDKVEDLYNKQIDRGKDIQQFVSDVKSIVKMITEGVNQNPNQNNTQE